MMNKNYLQKLIRVILVCICSLNVFSAELPDSKGKDFWLTFPQNYSGGTPIFFISSDVATSGTINVPGTGFSTTFTTTPGAITSVTMPTNLEIQTADGIQNKGIHVTATDEVTIYGLSRLTYTTDAYLGLPTNILGTEHIILSYPGLAGNPSQLTVVGTQNGTTVTITPSVTAQTRTAGVPFNITLNQGEVYQLQASGTADMTGTLVTSSAPVGVYGGTKCANVPSSCFACDFIVEQLPPVSAWGKSFVSAPLATRTGGDIFRFLASENSTTVSVNGAVVATLNKGQAHEMLISTNANITADKPILSAQYSRGSSCDGVVADPFMMLIPPYEQFLGNYTVGTPDGFTGHYINLVVPSAAIGDVQLDGSVVPAISFSAIGGSGFYSAQLTVAEGSHNINSNYPVGVHSYGFGNYDSYGYPGGQSLSPIGFVNSLSLAPANSTNEVGASGCITATVLDNINNPVAGIRVDFSISGPNAGSGFAFTDANGEAVFCYTGTVTGTDNITATSGSLTSNTVNKTWNCAAISFTATATECSNGSGSITVSNVSGGVAPYQYSVDGGANYSANAAFSGLGLGTYNVIVKDAANCLSAVQQVNVADVTAPVALCNDISVQLDVNGNASVTVAQIDAGSSDNCGIASITVAPSSFTCDNVGDNAVTLTVTDVGGNVSTCTATVTVADDINPCCAAPVAVCNNITIALDINGTASITPQDVDGGSIADCGLADLSFLTTVGSTEIFSDDFASGTAGWTLTLIDGNGGWRASGGNPGALFILNDNGKVASDPTISRTINGLIVGETYQITGDYRNWYGCCGAVVGQIAFGVDVDGSEIAALPNPGQVWTPFSVSFVATSASHTIGFRGEINGTDTEIAVDNITVTGAALASVNSLSFDCSDLGANTVTLSVTDVNGEVATCDAVVTVTSTIPPALTTTLSDFNGYNVSCFGGSNGTASVSATGACQPYTYAWSTVPAQTSATATALSAGTYTVTVTDAGGAAATATVTLTEPAEFVFNIINETVYYGYADSACAEIGSGVSGGVAPYTYAWSNGETTATINVCPEFTQSFYVTVTDANGCSDNDSVKVCVIDVTCSGGGNNLSSGGDKVMICHIPDGNPNKARTLCIDAEDIEYHLAHGDKLGMCSADMNCFNTRIAGYEGESKEILKDAAIINAYPNPFSNVTTIEFEVASTQKATLKVYDITGIEVAVLFDNTAEEGRTYKLKFDAGSLNSGMYFYKLNTESGSQLVKNIVLSR